MLGKRHSYFFRLQGELSSKNNVKHLYLLQHYASKKYMVKCYIVVKKRLCAAILLLNDTWFKRYSVQNCKSGEFELVYPDNIHVQVQWNKRLLWWVVISSGTGWKWLTDNKDNSLSCLLSLRPITEDIFLSDVTVPEWWWCKLIGMNTHLWW